MNDRRPSDERTLVHRVWWRTLALVLVPLCAINGSTVAVGVELIADATSSADQRLPVGDGRWTVDQPRRGWVYVCPKYAAAMRAADATSAAPAPATPAARQPWFSDDGRWYYPARKPKVSGDEHHHGAIDAEITGQTLTVRTDSVPVDHGTGVFPIAVSDPAFAFDRNPNSITVNTRTFRLELPRSAPEQQSAYCVSNEVGVMLTGPLLLSALDAAGRDGGAWEVQDSCSGHPEANGTYHYHTPSPCGTANRSVDEIVGWALDGYPITGGRTHSGYRLGTADLDECHGMPGPVRASSGEVFRYRYVLTADFPYSVSCFRAPPARTDHHGTAQGKVADGDPGNSQRNNPSHR